VLGPGDRGTLAESGTALKGREGSRRELGADGVVGGEEVFGLELGGKLAGDHRGILGSQAREAPCYPSFRYFGKTR